MHFELSQEEELLKQTVADFGRSHFGGQSAPRTVDAEWRSPWASLAKMGLAGILVPEQFGGSGGTVLDACLIAEQLGHADAWIPFAGTGIVAAAVLGAADRPDGRRLADLAAGGVYSLLLDGRLGWPAAEPCLAFDWRDDARLIAADGGGAVTVLDEAEVTGIEAVDLLHPAARMAGVPAHPAEQVAGVPAHPAGQVAGVPVGAAPPTPAMRLALATGRVGLAAWLTGVAAVALEEAVEYAKNRRQFGVPIGSFQAVQHLCADMLVDVETCRSIAYGAAWTVGNRPLAEAERAAATAKSWCSRKAVAVCETSIQVFGGIGVTWEHPAHLRLRNAHQFAAALGGYRDLNRQLARAQITAEGDADGPE